MSKRTATISTITNPKDFWETPLAAAAPLGEILPSFTEYDEPCAGNGALVEHLFKFDIFCAAASDINPRQPFITHANALDVKPTRMIITNPPFSWPNLQPLLDHWIGTVECWLLLPLDMIANKRVSPYAVHIRQVLPIGRVSWLGNNKGGMENYAWLNFAIDPQRFVLPRR